MKKINYPKIEGYLKFADPFIVGNFILIPTTLLIYNQSYYIHEKNVEYRILTVGCDVANPFSGIYPTEFSTGYDVTQTAKSVLHRNMPFHDEIALVLNDEILRSHNGAIKIFLTIWGELSPIVSSYYELLLFPEPISPNRIALSIIKKSENTFLFEKSQELEKTGDIPNLEKTHQDLSNNYKERFTTTILYRSLRGQL